MRRLALCAIALAFLTPVLAYAASAPAEATSEVRAHIDAVIDRAPGSWIPRGR